MIELELIGPLTVITGGRKSVKIGNAATVLEAMQHFTRMYPEAVEKFFNGKAISKRIIIYVDDMDIRLLQGELTVLSSESRIRILTALTGG